MAAPARSVIRRAIDDSIGLIGDTHRKRLEPGSVLPRAFPAALLFQRVLQAADRVLDLAFDLVALAASLQLGVTEGLADSFLNGTFSFLGRTNDAIIVHVVATPFVYDLADNFPRRGPRIRS